MSKYLKKITHKFLLIHALRKKWHQKLKCTINQMIVKATY